MNSVVDPGCDLQGDVTIWWFLDMIYVIDIMDRQAEWREGLSYFPFIMNEGRERGEPTARRK